MEFYIAKRPWQEDAWKLYIKYFEDKNNWEAMLGVYSRYCRFFLDDLKMKSEYQEKVIELKKLKKNVEKWILDLVDMETLDSEGNMLEKLKIEDFEAMLGVYSRYCRFFLDDLKMKSEYQEKVIELKKLKKNVEKWILDLVDMETLDSEGNMLEKLKIEDFVDSNEIQKYKDLIQKFHEYQNDMDIEGKIIENSDAWFTKPDFEIWKPYNITNIVQSSDLDLSNQNHMLQQKNKCEIYWNDKNMIQQQKFEFCSEMIRYISKPPKMLQKLYKTCKYFF
uniref:Uncharacterized protein n=1 Tax=Panagrolaimus sp. ES5 TaxID=591445 RepID=A0AC34FNW3_9BILA